MVFNLVLHIERNFAFCHIVYRMQKVCSIFSHLLALKYTQLHSVYSFKIQITC